MAMEKHSNSTVFLLTSSLLLVLLFCYVPAPSTCHEVEKERDFSYIAGSSEGPEHWGDLHEHWATCKNGTEQSPVDLDHERMVLSLSLGRLVRRYKAAHATLKNRGHDIKLGWTGNAGFIRINGTEYFLKQLHWHFPSEHTASGMRFQAEMHMVHKSSDNKTAVIGILYKQGHPDQFLSELLGYMREIADKKEEERDVGSIDPRHTKFGSGKYYRYFGSLSTPPCTEGIVWTIFHKVKTVSREQVRLLQDAVQDEAEKNARPIQPINRRMIQFYPA